MNYNDILGYFDGKDIFLDMGNNLKSGLSPSTYIHEISHKVLNLFCGIGIVENMIKEHMEINENSENKELFKCILTEISNFSYEVHEIYANTIEMIEIKRIFGNETWNRIYNMKTDEYKAYADYYLNVIDLDKAKDIILDHCIAALFLNVLSDEFIAAMNKPELFIRYMNSQSNPMIKLKQLKDNFIKYHLPIDKKIVYFVHHEELMARFLKETPLKNDDCSYFEFMINMYNNMFKSKELRNIYEKVTSSDVVQLIGDNIKLLDFSSIRPVPLSNAEFFIKASGVIQIVNGFKLRGYKPLDEEYYVIFLDSKNSTYYSTIGEESYINKLLGNDSIFGALILLEEFSEDFSRHKYLNKTKKDKYVIIRDYISSISFLNDYITNHKILYSSIDENSGPGVITTFIFRDTQNDELMFVYPTTKNVAGNLMKLIDHNGEFLGADEFEKIFSKETGLLSFGYMMLHLLHMNSHKFLRK